MTARIRGGIAAFSVLGLVASSASTWVHYRLLHDPTYTSFCNVSASINCETAYQSAYGTVAGVPVAVAGVLWFLLVLLLTWAVKPSTPSPNKPSSSDSGDSVGGYLFALSTIALAVVLYLAYASLAVLKTTCILCVLTYVAVIGIFILSGMAGPARLGVLPAAVVRDLRRLVGHPAAMTVAILYVAGAASAVAFFPRESGTRGERGGATASATNVQPDQRAQFEQWMATQPHVPIAVPNDGAKVLIIKFNDYQCPPCRQTYMQYKSILAKYQTEYPGQVKFVTKDFPLEAECNTGGAHEAACEAAAAVHMARAKNHGEALEEWLFDNQPAMTPDLVRKGVREIGGVSDFDAQYPRVLEQVKGDVALGRQLGVNRTPTFFINGVKIEGGLLPQFFEAAIAFELKRAQASQP
jgi:uncharacterized membrane protein/protein-disulfide isomerase